MRKKDKKIGVFIGKFFPLHFGHVMQIAEIAKSCDLLFVVLADSEERSKKLCNESGLLYISPQVRFLWIKKYFANIKNIKVKFINQGMLEAYPNSLKNWKTKLLSATKHKYFTWFVDSKYLEISKKTFPEFSFEGFNRNNINLTAKQIRLSPSKSQKLMPKYIYNKFKFYIKNV